MSENTSFLVESGDYADLFVKYPPKDLPVFRTDSQTVFFRIGLDLLTTVDPALRRRITALPFYRLIRPLLTKKSLFAGETITEYCPLAQEAKTSAILSESRQALKDEFLLIIKDLPVDSPLLSPEENARADQIARQAQREGFWQLEGQALAYVPIDFESMDQWFNRFSAARRKNLRRKLKSEAFLDIEEVPLGDTRFHNPDFIDEIYSLYTAVYEQSEIRFDVLTRDFFAALLTSTIPGVCLLYYDKESRELIGWNILLIHNRRLIDKFIGLRYPQAHHRSLYFVSWKKNLEFALAHGLTHYIAGWTDPEVKKSLGASFTMTRHLVYVTSPLMRFILKPFKGLFEADSITLNHSQS